MLHIRLNNGKWEPVLDSPFNRSVNANVAMQLVGPAAGSRLVKTNADPSGTRCFGTFGNCGNGYTLWNTYLTCEENFTDYFGISNAAPASVNYPDEYQRHGALTGHGQDLQQLVPLGLLTTASTGRSSPTNTTAAAGSWKSTRSIRTPRPRS